MCEKKNFIISLVMSQRVKNVNTALFDAFILLFKKKG